MTRLFARLLAPTLAAAALLLVPAVAAAKPATPKITAPKAGMTVSSLPTLTWNPVKNAASYEVQIASDAGFNPALVDVTTSNLRYLNNKTLSNGAYYWRVRAIDAASASSKWSGVRKFTKKWNSVAALLTPASLASIAYPSPAVLTWLPVPGASTYRVSIATGAAGGGVDAPGGIISNGALAWSDSGQPIVTSNTNLAISTALHPGTYYWQVVPVDPEGHAGAPSAIMSFAWTWAGTTTPTVTDMVAGPEIFDPLFSWTAIPGAASYQIEVNTTAGYAPGSRLMLLNTNATSFAPRQTLPNNTYYWRVRGVDPQGQAGPWNNGPSFDKTYDQTPAPQGPQNLRVLNTKLQPIADGGVVQEPVLEWNTVPGARAYEVSISCNGGQPRIYVTSNTAWTPFAQTTAGPPPFLNSPNVSIQSDSFALAVGCDVLVRAFTDNAVDGTTVYGPYAAVSFLYGPDVGGEPGWSNPPPVDCLATSCAGRLTGANFVLQPGTGTTVTKSPVICWKPVDMDSASGITPSRGYWVSIARDPNFTTIVQTAYVPEPCYAPPVPLVDEATSYYWQVIPVDSLGNSSSWRTLAASSGGFPLPPSFQHASVPPLPMSPIGGAAASGPVVFRWAPVPEQVKDYTIEIAQDESFSTILESASTDATSYSATTTYPVGATVFWRVRANNNNSQGLAWSATSSFVQTLPVPAITTAQPLSGATFPPLSWTPVDGATSYEVQDVWPDASVHVTSGIPSTAVSYTKMTGTGHGTVQVRAVFGNVKGAYSPVRDVNHTIAEPGGTKTSLIDKPGKRALSISWNTKTNVKQYKVQFSRTPGFAAPFFEDVTDLASYTPTLTQQDFLDGGVMYWRVAVIDPDGNVGAFSKPKKFTLLGRLQVQYAGQQPHGVHAVIVVSVVNARSVPVKGAAVRLTGAGIRTGTKKTDKKGTATFSVTATRAGNLTATATKKSFKPGKGVAPIA